MEPVIIAQNLYKIYKLGTIQVEVLKNINLVIGRGEFVSIMGPSGSGKSTFLYLAGGLDKPTSGHITIQGHDMALMQDGKASVIRRKNIGFIFQFYNLIPNLNTEENILLPVMLDGGKAKNYQNRLNEIMENVGISHRRKHTPREMSGGEQQRVAIARALVNNPDVILADEPTGNLDSKTGAGIMELLKTINGESGKTIIMVTHSNEAAAYGSRTINIKDGMVVME